ncbi:MAG: hypothetical protein F4Z31_14115 [Gemmatimonadetes bacterium]|nr:hypothetical protein [Gemmatimonadota bacterium]MYA42872.1 hypothetical protein [Gemmatimonadota bacterium]MYE93926.1 hypothetical protein [Gemmatimonadota bacterium]MYJ09435.1 hypothetical protein [Gemmatimonadota bacterium]
MTSSRYPSRIARGIAVAFWVVSCAGDSDPTPETATWVTVPEFEIGDAFGGPAAFAQVSDVRVSPDGERVFVLEPYLARVSVWTPEGDILLDIEKPGEGPGEFRTPLRVEPNPDGFSVQDTRRFTFFTHDGRLLRTVPNPPPAISFRGFRLQPRLLTESDGYVAVPAIPGTVAAGWTGDDPLDELPLLHVRAEDDRWTMDTIAVLDVRNRSLAIRPAGSEWEFTWELHTGQPLADDDLTYFDPETGNVVIAHRNFGDGSIQLLEITPPGDTIWHRRFAVQPVSLRPELLEGAIDVFTGQLVNQSTMAGQPVSRGEGRALVEAALYAPDPLPSVRYVRGMSTGDLWMQTFEEVDSLVVWYTIGRGDTESALQRVLLPTGFRARDATPTHVWGVRRDSLGVAYVTGRKLVRRTESG